jgi:hypothetical protein
MSHYSVVCAGHVLRWSTVVDQPVSFGMTWSEYRRAWKTGELVFMQRGDCGLGEPPPIDPYIGCSRDDWVGSEALTEDEVALFYVRRRQVPTKGQIGEWRAWKERQGKKSFWPPLDDWTPQRVLSGMRWDPYKGEGEAPWVVHLECDHVAVIPAFWIAQPWVDCEGCAWTRKEDDNGLDRCTDKC